MSKINWSYQTEWPLKQPHFNLPQLPVKHEIHSMSLRADQTHRKLFLEWHNKVIMAAIILSFYLLFIQISVASEAPWLSRCWTLIARSGSTFVLVASSLAAPLGRLASFKFWRCFMQGYRWSEHGQCRTAVAKSLGCINLSKVALYCIWIQLFICKRKSCYFFFEKVHSLT